MKCSCRCSCAVHRRLYNGVRQVVCARYNYRGRLESFIRRSSYVITVTGDLISRQTAFLLV